MAEIKEGEGRWMIKLQKKDNGLSFGMYVEELWFWRLSIILLWGLVIISLIK